MMQPKRVVKSSPSRLEFGCGPSLSVGFDGVDIRWFRGVKYICNSWEIDKYVKGESVSEIYSRHFLEHLTFVQVELTIQVWRRLQIKGGRLVIVIPDIDYHISQWLAHDGTKISATNSNWTLRQHAIAGFWGWQSEGSTKSWDVHKSGFNYQSIRDLLVKNGYCDVLRIEDKPWNLNVQATKC